MKGFTKADLKNRMVVECRKNEIYSGFCTDTILNTL